MSTECQIAGMQAENERLKETIREQGEQVQHLADNLKEARDENERLKAALSDYAGLANLVI